MTQSEEIVTIKGESQKTLESVFFYNKNMEVSYRMNMEDREQIEIRLSHPNVTEVETYQMIFMLQGNIRVTKTGSNSTFAEINTHQHNLCRLPFKATRMLVNNADDMICINISTAFLNRFLPSDHPAYKKLLVENRSENPLSLSAINMQITPEISTILQMLTNFTESSFADQLLLESKAIELFALQIVQFEQMQKSKMPAMLKKSEIGRMYEAREILINQTGEQLSLRNLAHLVGTNEFNLKRDFKLLFGKTVFAYLNQHKMEKAKAMLIDEDITISEISKRMGYKHATHFTNAFKKHFNFLPNKIKSGKFSLLLFMEDFIAFFENFEFFAL
ncbi:helix-turn-helix domain-containing protein [Pedobacter mucosus]|uniref:helix-turn-helix domain-containing protein n=1 Tax=Pedobacter mucosus TaxID=2895286 RepID=UPI001EE3FD5B|nr:AraC family transcriptional regulator [Pedobacter mucosus]UKT64513.1 AraC family transcriptional regulator [Pedobacter mucosus]